MGRAPWQRNGECRGLRNAEVGSQAAGIVQGEETRARVRVCAQGFMCVRHRAAATAWRSDGLLCASWKDLERSSACPSGS